MLSHTLIKDHHSPAATPTPDPWAKGNGSNTDEAELVIPIDMGLVGETVRTGRVISIEDCARDVRFDRTLDRKLGFFTTSMLCARSRRSLVGEESCIQQKS